MKSEDRFNRTQLLALMSVMLMSPALRIYPGAAAELAGRAVWLSPLAALPPLLLYAWFLRRFFGECREGEGLDALCLRCLGGPGGRAVLIVLALWLLFYGAFLLRASADRFVGTVFPFASPRFFILCTGLALLPAALVPLRSLARMARLLLPPLLALLAGLLLCGLLRADRTNLLPLTAADALPAAAGALTVINLVSPMLYLPGFLLPAVERRRGPLRDLFLWLAGCTLLLTALGAAVLGAFGASVTARLSQPFFTLVRNLVFFRGLERMEALVVCFWIFPDYLLCAVLLRCGVRCLRSALTPTGGRWLLWPCAAGLLLTALLLAPERSGLLLWSERIVPLCNLAAAFLLIPGIRAAGKLRKKL